MAVRDNASTYAIVRTGWLYGIGGNNFIKSILSAALNQKGRKSLKMVDDQFGSPTWTYRLAQQIREMIKADARGTFHATSEGYCSRLECAEFVFNKIGIRVSLHPISLEDYPQKARRPVNCILENRLLKKQGLNVMADWKEDLSTFLDQFGEQLIKEAKAGTSGKS
jgi:dTDP-4-dehydrorhamnose reductase